MVMGPQGLSAAEINTLWSKRILAELHVDRMIDGPGSDDDYDAYEQFLNDYSLGDRAPTLTKSNKVAARVRAEGNRYFLEEDYFEALGRYNECICYAKVGSEDMGIAYANRSAVFYALNEFELALVNIRLAKKYNYPERLMGKLKVRELNCQHKLAAGESKGLVPCPRMNINVETNPKIPFLAKGITMEVLPDFGRSMIAQKDFKTCEVILDEKCIFATIDAERRYYRCGHCSTEGFYSLVPCPNCVSVMYCSQRCLERNWKYMHRFECSVSDKLQYISYGHVAMGAKLFLYGLTLFNDDLEAMMSYFETLEKSGGNALNLDYTQYDPMEEFKDLCNINVVNAGLFAFRDVSFAQLAAAAHIFMLLKNPTFAAIVNTATKRDFTFQRMTEFVKLALFYKWEPFCSPLCPIASLFNHSCDPNAVATIHSDQIRIVVLRPIRKNEQITISYGSTWWDNLAPYTADFICKCDTCDRRKKEVWKAKAPAELPSNFYSNLETAFTVLEDESINNATKLNAIVQFIERYAYLHPRPELAGMVGKLQDSMRTLTEDEDGAYHRAIASQELESED